MLLNDQHSQCTGLLLSPNFRWKGAFVQCYKTIVQREVANIVSYLSKSLYIADKHNKCKYLIDTGAAVSVLPKSCADRTSDATCVLPKSCADRTSDATCLPLVAANNTTINTHGWSQTRLRLDIHSSRRQTTNYRSWFSHTLQLTGRLKKSLSERHASVFSYTSYLIV